MRILFTLSILLGLSSLPSLALAKDELVRKQSTHSVAKTLDRLTHILKSKGITIFERVDHAAGAKKVGMELRPTQVLIFGNPKMGTPLMLADQRIGLSLPMKVLAYQDSMGKVWLSYRKPLDVKNAYGLTGRDKVFAKMKGALNKFTDMAIK